ncbi:hypothetical protein [Helicobacter sp. WB40]|uniref:hypothetical protein n=1 Tax=Helicobacter sp. WB40 TaxID=3004130 RepID=UPI0022EBCC3D|nr:hypothetical protein [Helicobacter sp. WB40]MDA3967088.1 hypothetical protein [Helicobacter sp. WB40]
MVLSSINNNANLFIRNNSSNNTNTESSFNAHIHNKDRLVSKSQERYDLMINGITYGGIFDDYILADKITNKLNNKINHSNKQQADEAKAFLQQEMKNFLEEHKELIEKARYAMDNLDVNSQEYKDIMVKNGGLELLSNLRFIEKNESIGDYDIKPDSYNNEVTFNGIIGSAIRKEIDFFGAMLPYISDDKADKITDALTTIYSYYLSGDNVEIDGKVYNYDVKPDKSHPLTYLAYLKEEPTNIQNNNISLESFLLSAQTNMQKSMFDVLDIRDNNTYNSNTKYYKESKYDSIIKDILEISKEVYR